MTHIGAFQIPDTMTLARHASKAGADAVASMPPAYFAKPNFESLVKFYQQIAILHAQHAIITSLEAQMDFL